MAVGAMVRTAEAATAAEAAVTAADSSLPPLRRSRRWLLLVAVEVVKASTAAQAVARASKGVVPAEGVKAAKAVVREAGKASAAEVARAE